MTLAYDINDRIQVVGQYLDAGAVPDDQGRVPAGTAHGFLWRDGEIITIDVPGAPLTQPLGINNHGDVVGAYIDADADPDDPYAYYDTGRLRGFLMHGQCRTHVHAFCIRDWPNSVAVRARRSVPPGFGGVR